MNVFTGRMDHAPESKLAPTSAEEEGVVGGRRRGREGGREGVFLFCFCFFQKYLFTLEFVLHFSFFEAGVFFNFLQDRSSAKPLPLLDRALSWTTPSAGPFSLPSQMSFLLLSLGVFFSEWWPRFKASPLSVRRPRPVASIVPASTEKHSVPENFRRAPSVAHAVGQLVAVGVIGGRAGHDPQAVGTHERATPLAPSRVGEVLDAQRAPSEPPQRTEVQRPRQPSHS